MAKAVARIGDMLRKMHSAMLVRQCPRSLMSESERDGTHAAQACTKAARAKARQEAATVLVLDRLQWQVDEMQNHLIRARAYQDLMASDLAE